MPDQRFERVVDAYLDNTISPGDLAWLRSTINLDDGLHKWFLKKCRQHQSTQYFMVQQSLSPDWGGLSLEDLEEDEPSHVSVVAYQKPGKSSVMGNGRSGSSRSSRGRNIRAILDYSILSGLICLTIVLGVAWLDRGRLYHRDHNPGLDFHDNALNKAIYTDNAYHVHLQKPQELITQGEEPVEAYDGNYISVHQLHWFFQQEDRLMDGQWGDVPTDYGVDFEKLDLLLNQSRFNASDFPHSMLNPEPLFQGKMASP